VYFVISTIAGSESSLLRTYCFIPGGNTPQRPFNENVGGPQSRAGLHVMANKAVTVTAVQPAVGHRRQANSSDGVTWCGNKQNDSKSLTLTVQVITMV